MDAHKIQGLIDKIVNGVRDVRSYWSTTGRCAVAAPVGGCIQP